MLPVFLLYYVYVMSCWITEDISNELLYNVHHFVWKPRDWSSDLWLFLHKLVRSVSRFFGFPSWNAVRNPKVLSLWKDCAESLQNLAALKTLKILHCQHCESQTIILEIQICFSSAYILFPGKSSETGVRFLKWRWRSALAAKYILIGGKVDWSWKITRHQWEWVWTQADALHKLCLSSALQVIQIFNTALQDLKKICRIRGCKPGQLNISILSFTESCIQFPNN